MTDTLPAPGGAATRDTDGLWLTRILLDTRHRDARRDLRDSTALHRRVMSLLPDALGATPRAAAAAMFRIEETPTGVGILVQTRIPPDLARLPAGYGHAQTRDIGAVLHALRPGLVLRYRIDANPSKRLAVGPAQGKTVGLRGPDADGWWTRRAAMAGLALNGHSAQPRPATSGTASNGAKVRHHVIRFEGTATVTSPVELRAAVIHGIGRGRSYGCGLLSLAP